jgi:hypothetical protein
VCPRAGLHAVEKTKIFPLPGFKPRLSSPSLYRLRYSYNIYTFRARVIIVISGCHGNDWTSGNMSHESEFCNRSRTREQSFVSVFRVYSLSINNILM